MIWSTLFVSALVLPVNPPCFTQALPIPASARDQFEKWTDDQIDALLKCKTVEQADAIIARLENAGVEWPTFLTRLPKNKDFPQQMLTNAWFRRPGHRVSQLLPGSKKRRCKKINIDHTGMGHSSYFTVTDIASYTPDQIARQYADFQPVGKMKLDKVKDSGTSEGIWVEDEKERKYILVFDPPCCPEMTTSAEFIGSTITRILGYNVPKTCICTVRGTGNPLYDGRRAVATLALDNFKGGYRLGPARDRREIRALRVSAGWINNVDQTEQNTAVTKTKAGCYRHYVLDFGASLGSFTYRPQIARMGWTRLFSLKHQLSQGLYDRGIKAVPWNAPYSIVSPAVGYFHADFSPDDWKPFYPNMGFIYLTNEDARWAAGRIAQFTPDQLATIVDLAQFTHQADRDHVLQTLLKRQRIIVNHYLSEPSADENLLNQNQQNCP